MIRKEMGRKHERNGNSAPKLHGTRGKNKSGKRRKDAAISIEY